MLCPSLAVLVVCVGVANDEDDVLEDICWVDELLADVVVDIVAGGTVNSISVVGFTIVVVAFVPDLVAMVVLTDADTVDML